MELGKLVLNKLFCLVFQVILRSPKKKIVTVGIEQEISTQLLNMFISLFTNFVEEKKKILLLPDLQRSFLLIFLKSGCPFVYNSHP